MSLIEELGLDYFNERFNGSMFFDENKNVCIVSTEKFIRNNIYAKMVEGTVDKPIVKEHSVPFEFFTDLTVFKTPLLGWSMAAEGKYLAHLSRNNRSYHRGTSSKTLLRRIAPSTKFLIDTGSVQPDAFTDMYTTARSVMAPEYVPFRQGLEAMRRGDLFSFAVSPTIAVIPEVDDHQAIYLNTNRAAVVTPDGEVVYDDDVVIPYIKDYL